jgi:transcriptional regulator with XRE-family HTH domain
MSLSQNIKKYRTKRGCTQEKLAGLSKVTYNTLIKLESGATRNPRVLTLKPIAKVLKVKVDDLLN